MRIVLLVVLLLQLLSTPAMAGGHLHGWTNHDTSASHPHAGHGPEAAVSTQGDHPATANDASHPDERCCCAFMGHCSSSAVAAQASASTPYSGAAHDASRATAGLARGFDNPPYRPPSFI